MSSEKLNLRKKLVKIRSGVEYLQKTETGNSGKYIDPAILLKKIRDLMDANGVLLCPEIIEHNMHRELAPTKNNKDQNDYMAELKMSFVWMDSESDESITIPWFATGSHMKDPAMAFGSALTYTERYFLLKFFQIPTSKDDPEYFNSKTREPEPQALTISPEYEKIWRNAKAAYKRDGNFIEIEKKGTISEDNKKLMIQECENG